MDDCVNGDGNTGIGYKIPSGELVGKTGTAQIARENGGGYLNGKADIISSFAGIYPKSNPQVIIYASVKRPTNGSQKPVSNAVKEIVENLSKYYGNTETNNGLVINSFKLDNYTNKKLDNVKIELDTKKVNYIVLGNGNKIIKQSPNPYESFSSNDTLYLITNDSNITVPNVVGLSSKIAKDILSKLNIKVNLDGVGYVTTQSVPEGTIITEGMEMILTLSPKYVVE
jgi:penicillin-binding protein 2B